MIRRWCVYLAVLLGCFAFFLAYQGWLAWLLLTAVFWLPALSLLVSLPAMLTTRLTAGRGATIPQAMAVRTQASAACRFPLPRYRCRIRVTHSMTGESRLLSVGDPLPTEHCGRLICRPEKCWVYDYLGMFCLKIRKSQDAAFIVRPAPVAVQAPADLERYMAQAWRPKPGGGFSENHELRLYRPGDNLNQVHWKLTAKTGKLIIREAMEPERRRLLLTLDLKGTPGELDRKLGKLLWMGRYLLEQGLHYEIHALTGKGLQNLKVTSERELELALDRLLCQPVAEEGSVLTRHTAAAWCYHIGGGTDEA